MSSASSGKNGSSGKKSAAEKAAKKSPATATPTRKKATPKKAADKKSSAGPTTKKASKGPTSPAAPSPATPPRALAAAPSAPRRLAACASVTEEMLNLLVLFGVGAGVPLDPVEIIGQRQRLLRGITHPALASRVFQAQSRRNQLKIIEANHRRTSEGDRPFQNILELPYVPRKIVIGQG